MKLLEKIILLLDHQMTEPALFGWFHLLWLGITAAAVFLACRFGPKASKRQVDRIVLITAIVVAILEVYKQINYTFSVGENGITADYHWYAFPFQFCSTPMYVGLLAGIFRKGKFNECLCSYLATFAVFAGLAVSIYPGDVFVETTGINIQTMICHGSMIPIGTLLFASGRVSMNYRTVLKACCVFVVTLSIACVLNEVAYSVGLLENHNFNMFYISRHLDSTLPVFSLVQPLVPFPVSFIIYVVGFTAAAYLMMLLHKLMLRNRAKTLVATH